MAALAVPVLVDLACVVTAPLERRLAARFVDEAAARLRRVAPDRRRPSPARTGRRRPRATSPIWSAPRRSVVATPASFNNRAGLARAVNEHLADGTEVFVAEMGTYGPGEIAELCRWCPPDIAVITAIGPVHLERFGSEERIVEAKAEILEPAADVVLPVDDARLAALAERAAGEGKRVAAVFGGRSLRPTSAWYAELGRGRAVGVRVTGGPGRGRRGPDRACSPPTWPAPSGSALAARRRPGGHRGPARRPARGRPPAARRARAPPA